jgi:hypothetical protein
MVSIYKTIDFLSFKENIKIEKKSMYSTIIGGILSFLLVVLLMLGSFHFISDLWTNSKSNIVVSDKIYEDIDQNFNDFYIYFSLQSINNTKINYFHIYGQKTIFSNE